MKEKDLQKHIVEYLRLKGYLVVKFPSVGIWKKETGSYIPQPQIGISDLLFWKSEPSGVVLLPLGRGTVRRYGAIEVKIKPRKPTQAQLDFGEQMKRAGGVFIVAYSLEDVVEAVG